MTGFAILQTSASVLQKSAEMAEKDPHGAIITLVSVSVVFCALIILFFAYSFIGDVTSGKISFPKKKKAEAESGRSPDPEEAAAIGMALHRYLNDTVHDNESYVITIKRK